MQTALVTTNEQRIIIKARKGLSMVTEGEQRSMKGWLLYGEALNEGRGMFPSNNLFHDWLVSQQLAGTEDMERLAAMWAAGNPVDFNETKKANPRVRTVRGLHAKWKAPEPKVVTEVASHVELSMMRKLKVMADHPSTDAGTRENAQSKLDGYYERFGLNSQSLVMKEDKPNAVGMTRNEMKDAIVKAVFTSTKRSKAEALVRSALDAAYDDDDLMHTLKQTEEYL